MVVIEVESNGEAIAARVGEAIERVVGFAPDRVVVRPPRSIPRTANGKIRHAALRDELSDR